MSVGDTYIRGKRLFVERPLEIGIVLVIILLILDLVLKLISGTITGLTLALFLKDGIVIGLIIGLAGIGLSMTYSILNFANFAHGDYLTAGAFAGWVTTYLIAGFGMIPAGDLFLVGVSGGADAGSVSASAVTTPVAVLVGFVIAVLFGVALSLAIDRIVYRPMRGQNAIALLIASIGVALALRYVIAIVFGTSRTGVTGGTLPTYTVPVIDLIISAHELVLVIVVLSMMGGVHVLLQRTKLGKAMRAMADNPDLARVSGIPTEQVIRTTWMIGGGLTAAAGYLVVLETGTISFDYGWTLLLLIFAAVILGGIGSVYGAVLGGLTIGIASTMSLVWLPSEFTYATAFSVMIIILVIKPAGLFSGVTTA
ncbi:branched-chain amino acid ABC transporter permease [Haladaptatus pallidirubidus]|uniref:Branched-chain amino acid ABC transporter permease n=1 Tax=Haladaptatus pallidirubidus TaxID=1008152 RepID=A0AAV3UJK1_9EURY|nr:branched-chain amino acid ABC transporter permease [Haladaptatus pallidirubidus]